jgi:hypothetical protein
MKVCRYIAGIMLLGVLSLNSCIDEFNRGSETVYYNPSFSIPIGPLSYTLQEILPYATLGIPIPDSIVVSDSIIVPLLIYDDSVYFNNPEEGRDTSFFISVDFTSLLNQWEYIHSLIFRVNISNGLPVNVGTQLYFYDAGDNLIDSLYDNGKIWIESANVDQRGIVTSPFEHTYDIWVDSARVAGIIGSTRLGTYLLLETYHENIDTLRAYSSYHFDLQLAVRAELLIPLR